MTQPPAKPLDALSQKLRDREKRKEALMEKAREIVTRTACQQSNVYTTGPTIAQTYGNTTYFTGQHETGTHDSMLRVLILGPADADYAYGVDARMALGPDWQERVEDGVSTC